MMTKVTDYLENNKQRQLSELMELLKIPSVSTDPNHKDDLKEAANYIIEQLKALGFKTELRPTKGHPIVLAEYFVNQKLPTVLIYGHYDVQPVGPISEWDNPPFEPRIIDEKIYARGASDDKGQIFAHIKAVEALIKTTNTLPLNIKFLIEGEEEIGSPNLGPFLEQEKLKLACDLVIISDSAMIAPNTPTITYGLKGLAYIELEVIAANRDLHSGAYGGGVPNPINELAKIIAQLHDKNGKITVPGFYDDVIEISATEKAAFKKVPFDEKEFAEEIALKGTPGEHGYTVLERIWARPTLDVNGIKGGFQGKGAKTVIAAKASAKISCRLVSNQDPKDITKKLIKYIEDIAPNYVTVIARDLHGAKTALSPLDSKAVKLTAKALEKSFDKEVVFARTGGSIPIVNNFQEELGVDVVLVGFGLENDGAHSLNEKFDLKNYYDAIKASTEILNELNNF